MYKQPLLILRQIIREEGTKCPVMDGVDMQNWVYVYSAVIRPSLLSELPARPLHHQAILTPINAAVDIATIILSGCIQLTPQKACLAILDTNLRFASFT